MPPQIQARNSPEILDSQLDDLLDEMPPLPHLGNANDTQESTQDMLATFNEPLDEPDPKSKKKRAPRKKKKDGRPVLTRKKFLANYKLFLNPLSNSQFNDEDVFVQGTVVKSAKSNNNMYHLQWTEKKGVKLPLPLTHFVTFLEATEENVKLLVEAVDRYKSQHSTSASLPTAIVTETTAPLGKQQRKRSAEVAATPQPHASVAAHNASAVRTSSSTVSSLTSATRANTRSSQYGVESDTGASGQAMVNRREDRPANRESRPITHTWHARHHALPHNDTIEWRAAPKSALGTTYTSYTSSTAGTKPLVRSYDGMLVNIPFSH